jgi:ATP-dependent DNA helicase
MPKTNRQKVRLEHPNPLTAADLVAFKRGRGRPRKDGVTQSKISSFFEKRQNDSAPGGDAGNKNVRSSRQPKEVTGGIMRKYQLDGLQWMKSLYENGLNGILADEMGLGKTVQTISLLAFLREMGTYGPFLVIAPLSTTTNWVDEFHKWTPTIPVALYHGTPKERAKLRSAHFRDPQSPNFPVIVTSYEICMHDRRYLSLFEWQFIIIVGNPSVDQSKSNPPRTKATASRTTTAAL